METYLIQAIAALFFALTSSNVAWWIYLRSLTKAQRADMAKLARDKDVIISDKERIIDNYVDRLDVCREQRLQAEVEKTQIFRDLYMMHGPSGGQ